MKWERHQDRKRERERADAEGIDRNMKRHDKTEQNGPEHNIADYKNTKCNQGRKGTTRHEEGKKRRTDAQKSGSNK